MDILSKERGIQEVKKAVSFLQGSGLQKQDLQGT